ncbi:MAG: TAT-variant-translocated molybdopterin oxidoreductase [Verrucomicrobiota bacterium]
MKTIIEHPPVEKLANGGKAYWRSLADYSESNEFHQWLDREFPAGASEFWGDGVSRRNFLRLMGASMALAGFGMASCRRPEAAVVAFSKTPEWQIPGVRIPFATAMPRRDGAQPLLVQSFDGRPIKIEGNPLHPLGNGKSDTFAQSSLLDLYDPDRSSRFVKEGETATEADFISAFTGAAQGWKAERGAKLAILAEATPSPTTQRLIEDFKKQYPQAKWVTYEPAQSGNDAQAVEAAFGPDVRLRLESKKAEAILAFDSDFLGGSQSDLSVVRGFAKGRSVKKPTDAMNRLYVVEPAYSITGGMADHRAPLKAVDIPAAIAAFASEVAALTGNGSLSAMVSGLSKSALPGLDPQWLKESAKDLVSKKGNVAVLVGANYPVAVQALVLAINDALDAFKSVLVPVPWKSMSTATLSELTKMMDRGSVDSLVILGGNPCYNSPAGLNFSEALKKLKTLVHLSTHEDETSLCAHWHVPMAHYLESWGDAFDAAGRAISIQPLILPLFGGLSIDQVLSLMTGEVPDGVEGKEVDPYFKGPELVQATFAKEMSLTPDTYPFRTAWKKYVREGFDNEGKVKPASTAFNPGSLGSFVAKDRKVFTPSQADALEVVFRADSSMDDGRYNNNGWLMEMPDPITKLTWDNAVLMSPATAEKLELEEKLEEGIYKGQVITLSVNGNEITAPIHIVPGFAEGSLTLPLGYGRTVTGRVGEGAGFSAYQLMGSEGDYALAGVSVEPTADFYDFAITQEHWSMEGRGIVRQGPIEYYRKNDKFAHKQGLESHTPPNRSFYETPYETARKAIENGEPYDEAVYSSVHQWGMAIDLTTCTGCQACVVACQSENNIPIVGKDQVQKGREMHWMRLDRYFTATVENNGHKEDLSKFKVESKFNNGPDKLVVPNAPEMVTQPILCMQCENAPCETVCPVNATVHTNEGLNAMAYNRCIGTRYCANNCPYKVRRFNWFDYNQRQLDQLYISGRVKEQGWVETFKRPLGPKGTEELTKMSKNPNVTVRMRGVIEKCTFCVQRLEEAKINHKIKRENRTTGNIMVPTDSVQTACQQACPAEAITFGNLQDKNSKVVEVRERKHAYKLLDYLNTRPRVSYLAKLKNPNPAMPGADLVGMSLINATSHGDHGGHDDHGDHGKSHDHDDHSDAEDHGGHH